MQAHRSTLAAVQVCLWRSGAAALTALGLYIHGCRLCRAQLAVAPTALVSVLMQSCLLPQPAGVYVCADGHSCRQCNGVRLVRVWGWG